MVFGLGVFVVITGAVPPYLWFWRNFNGAACLPCLPEFFFFVCVLVLVVVVVVASLAR